MWCNAGAIVDWGQLTNLGASGNIVLDQVTTSTGSDTISLPTTPIGSGNNNYTETFASGIPTGTSATLSSPNGSVSGLSGLYVTAVTPTQITLSGDPGTTTTTGTIDVKISTPLAARSGQDIGIPGPHRSA